jgi:hypothetical protein
LQSIECSECGHLSQKLEHFLDVSVPVVTDPLLVAKSKDDDLDSLLADGRGPSKHQKKKERQASRKVRLSRSNPRLTAIHHCLQLLGKTHEEELFE